MEKQADFQEELQARIFIHKISILGGYLMKQYIAEEQAKGGVQIPTVNLEEMADIYSNAVMQKALEEGTFNDMYEKAWEILKNHLPEHIKTV